FFNEFKTRSVSNHFISIPYTNNKKIVGMTCPKHSILIHLLSSLKKKYWIKVAYFLCYTNDLVFITESCLVNCFLEQCLYTFCLYINHVVTSVKLTITDFLSSLCFFVMILKKRGNVQSSIVLLH